MSRKTLIVTADDFGVSEPVNEAVEIGHRRGILTAASLMVGAPATRDAVARARGLPKLGVGLHVTLVDGASVLPAEAIPRLVGPDGRFSSDPALFGVRLFLDRAVRREAEAEIRAQFLRFRQTGLTLDHVNSHHHFHLHPTFCRLIAKIAPEFGAPPVRVPHEPFWASWRAQRDRPLRRLFGWFLAYERNAALRRRFAAAGLATNDAIFGVNDSGGMTEARVLRFLRGLPDGISEIYCHPATRRWQGPDNLPARYRAEEEAAALISAEVAAAVREAGIRLAAFGQAHAA